MTEMKMLLTTGDYDDERYLIDLWQQEAARHFCEAKIHGDSPSSSSVKVRSFGI